MPQRLFGLHGPQTIRSGRVSPMEVSLDTGGVLNAFESRDSGSLLSYAAMLQLDVRVLTTDAATYGYEPRVQDDFMSGVQSGVNGTPTFFINGIRYDGPRDVASMLRHLKGVRRGEPF